MKKGPLLNAQLSALIARMGHGDMLVIGDAGLPVPPGVPCIDLAVSPGLPGIMPVLAAVLSELQVEEAVIAEEASPTLAAAFRAQTPCEAISHDALKELSAQARAVVRTGEFTPYANIVLKSGVVF